MLGYTQVSWDDETGLVREPLAARKPWFLLSTNEKMAAGLLGFTEIIWDNFSGIVQQPAAAYKLWSELTTCADGEDMFFCRARMVITHIPILMSVSVYFLSPYGWCKSSNVHCTLVFVGRPYTSFCAVLRHQHSNAILGFRLSAHISMVASMTDCVSEQAAVILLGYTEASWDNLLGREQQPWSSIKYWSSLTPNEKAAAEVLGYTETAWDNGSGLVPQPAAGNKKWAELVSCTNGKHRNFCAFVGI